MVYRLYHIYGDLGDGFNIVLSLFYPHEVRVIGKHRGQHEIQAHIHHATGFLDWWIDAMSAYCDGGIQEK